MAARYDAVVFDLLTALLNSWSLWNRVAGSDADGLRWRRRYLELTYRCGPYRPYEDIIREAASESRVMAEKAAELISRWDELEPWPEAPDALASKLPLGIATKLLQCPRGHRRGGHEGAIRGDCHGRGGRWYKPRPQPYRLALSQFGSAPGRTLFVAGSAADIPGASGVGMPGLVARSARILTAGPIGLWRFALSIGHAPTQSCGKAVPSWLAR